MNLSLFIERMAAFFWGIPLIVLLIGAGLYLTIRLRGIQFRGFIHGFNVVLGRYDRQADPGEINHFRALSAALSATVGTGNIVGVAAAILTGGPGAIFWMWITALLGMATKFASCTLAVHFRQIDVHGQAFSGPMYYIEKGLGDKFKWLAMLFACFTIVASFGIGNMFQVNNLVTSLSGLTNIAHFGVDSRVFSLVVGVAVASIVALIILGGIKSIARVAGYLVPFMCLFYVGAGIVILLQNMHLIGDGFKLIFTHAFVAPESVAGGLLGGVIRSGVARGLFSNEAGLGSAPMVHGAAKTNEPVREGLVAMLGPFIDTIVICTITALVIISTGAYELDVAKGDLTAIAFEKGLPGSAWMVQLGIVLFAFSTLLTWSYYGDRSMAYLFGSRSVTIYRWIYIVFIVIGAIKPLNEVINFCDAANALMALPNLIALFLLSGVVMRLTKSYTKRFIH